ncbi:hypothetical protein TUM20286_22950 [Pseudomonas tohonis]|uniref:Uncharacterized protein n=1 Tax=Pseudomonas tohonis TaxID=2725477 RepID=A0ABQ4VZD2_9PSED|nr:hypothetical protein TUM20286_22950 [Pseudomonas tohonis]
MGGADEYPGVLMIQVPIRHPEPGYVFFHAFGAGSKRMLGTESSRYQAESEFQRAKVGAEHGLLSS